MPIDVDGEATYVLAEDLDELASVTPTTAVRLLPGFDQYVLGPGTGDGHVVPTSGRTAVADRAADLVGRGGRRRRPRHLGGGDADRVHVAWFGEAGNRRETLSGRRSPGSRPSSVWTSGTSRHRLAQIDLASTSGSHNQRASRVFRTTTPSRRYETVLGLLESGLGTMLGRSRRRPR